MPDDNTAHSNKWRQAIVALWQRWRGGQSVSQSGSGAVAASGGVAAGEGSVAVSGDVYGDINVGAASVPEPPEGLRES